MCNKSIKMIFSVLLVLFVSSSQSYGMQNDATVKLSGSIAVEHGKEIRITNSPISLGDDWHYSTDSKERVFEIDANGNFMAEFSVEKPDFYRVTIKNKTFELFIRPNDSIYLEIDSAVNFGGNNAHLNQFFIRLNEQLNDNNLDKLFTKMGSLFNMESADFSRNIDSLKQISFKIYTKFISENKNIPTFFKERCVTDINCCYSFIKLLYPIVFENINGYLPKISSSYFNEIAQENLNHPNLLNSKLYMKFLDEYIEFKCMKNFEISKFYSIPREKIVSRYNVINNLDVADCIKDYLLEEHFSVCKINYSPKDWIGIFTHFKNNCKDTSLLGRVESSYMDALDLRKGPDEIKVFKEAGSVKLEAHIFYPKDYKKGRKCATYAFLHGGGWSIGMPEWGYANCKRYSAKGMLAVSFEYRLTDVHGTSIIECVEDAKSAIKWLRKYADELGVDPDKIVAEGFSAGGHLVAAAALIDGFEGTENMDISSKPNALIMQSASYNFAKSKWFNGMTNGKPELVSPYQHLSKNMAPAIMFHSTNDYLVSINEFKEFVEKMKSLNNDFEHYIFEGVGHFFRDKKAAEKVVNLKEKFLISRGFLKEVEKTD